MLEQIKKLQENNIIANRSLQSSHHATTMPPRILRVNWNLGKRCNYDCSYCSPHIHDNFSKHIDLNSAKNAINSIKNNTEEKQVDWFITGGEPFVHPHIIEILKSISDTHRTQESKICVITNGSLPQELYEESFNYLTHMTISIHLERTKDEIEKICEKIINLNNKQKVCLSVQLMCSPGKFEQIKKIKILLEKNKVKFTIRRIRPDVNQIGDMFFPIGTKSKEKFSLENKSLEEKVTLKDEYIQQKKENLLAYTHSIYTAEELEWMENNAPETRWVNVGFWFEDRTYEEYNSNELANNNKLNFKNWICYAGVDHIYIDFDGTLYRGACHAYGPFGHISDDEIKFPKDPVKCPFVICSSEADQPTRRAKNESYLDLIT